jgi:hypothetical protein
MIVGYLHLVPVSILPNEAQPVTIVHPNAVLPGTIACQGFQGVSGSTKIVETPRGVKLE